MENRKNLAILTLPSLLHVKIPLETTEVLRFSHRLSHPASMSTPTQRAIPPGLVDEYQQKLGSKRAYHAIQ